MIRHEELNVIFEKQIIQPLHTYSKNPNNFVSGLFKGMKTRQNWDNKVSRRSSVTFEPILLHLLSEFLFFQVESILSRSLFSALRRSPGLSRDPQLLNCVVAGCSSSDSVTARHAFAILKEQALVRVCFKSADHFKSPS